MVDEPLGRSLDMLIAESQLLRSDVQAAEEARSRENRIRRRENRITLMLSAVGIVAIAVVLVVVFQGARISRQNGQIADQIRSCTTPQGACYRQSQARTADVVRQIIMGQVYAEQCAKTTDTAAELEQCVLRSVQAPRP